MKRWPVVRHVRWLWNAWHFNRWWNAIGRHLGAVPNEADLRYLDDIWAGRV